MDSEPEPHLLNRMNNGRQIPTSQCQCAECEGEFFVPAMSDDWTPNYCPYCGVWFAKKDITPEKEGQHG